MCTDAVTDTSPATSEETARVCADRPLRTLQDLDAGFYSRRRACSGSLARAARREVDMGMRVQNSLVGLGLASAIVLGGRVAPEAAKPASPRPCSLTFLDRVGDKITSDNKGAYKDGTLAGGDSTVSCQVGGGNSDSIKLVLSAPSRKGTPRSFWGDYTNPVVVGDSTGTFKDGSYIIVEHVAQMAVGATQLAGAHFRFNGSWFFNWCVGPCGNQSGSDTVWVTAAYSNSTTQTGRSWNLSTDVPGGDVAQFQDGDTNSHFYHMPFKLEIDCPGCM